MLHDAALLTLDLCLLFNRNGNILKDANPWNILFQGPNPLFVDFTSIIPNEEDLLWVAYDQFARTFLFPLLVGLFSTGRAARALLLANQNGISPQELAAVLPYKARMQYPWLQKRLYIPMRVMDLMHKTNQDKDISKYTKNMRYGISQRETFFLKLKKDVESLAIKTGHSMWSQYYQDMNAFFSPQAAHAKQKVISDLLAKCKPGTVVDMGCNVGGYSILAAQQGAKVVAFDTDADSISMLYRLVKEKKLDILPLVADVLYPSPAAGWRAQEFPSMPERFRSDMGLALALEHHLAISQNQTFDRVVATLDEYCDKWLITEFIPITDPRVQELLLTNRRDMSWYTLENFLQAVRSKYRTVETYPSYPEGRVLCFCEK
jgi:SAM-dependent methyltransferase